MSSLIEDPAIPLVGMNDKRQGALHKNLYLLNRGDSTGKQSTSGLGIRKKPNPNFENVSLRLAMRKELYAKRKKICDASLGMAIVGIVIMIVETELTESGIISRRDTTSIVLKMFVTASTVTLVVLIGMYYRLGVQLFIINNSMDNWRLAIRSSTIVTFVMEIAICLVHPIPGEYHFSWYSTEQVDHGSEPIKVPLDVILSLPMFLRLYLICRFMMLHSRLYQDASCQSLGALNRMHFNFRFIFKSFMALYPEYFLATFIIILFAITTWSLRLCEMNLNDEDSDGNHGHDNVHENILNSMWVIATTFLTVGYGDIVPNTHCGRGIAVLTGILGTGCTALIVAVLARKLELSQSEKYVHNFVLEIDIGNKLKIQAANVVKHGWKLYKFQKIIDKTRDDEKKILKLQTKMLHAIYNTRELKNKRRRLTDSAVTLVEVSKSQGEMHRGLAHARIRQIGMEERMSRVENMVSQIHEKLCGQ